MTRHHWRNPHSSMERYYGLGTISGSLEGWEWFGHSGGLQGYASTTCVVPERELAVCILTNATDGWAGYWVEGALHILRRIRNERRAIGQKRTIGPGGGGRYGVPLI